MPGLRGRAFRLPGDTRDMLKANKPLSAVAVAKSLPLCPLSRAPTAQQTSMCVRGGSRGLREPPSPRLPWFGVLAEFLLESAELSAGKPGGLGERSPSRQDGEEEEEGAMLNVQGRG